jgi:hypothetical protein
LTEDDEVASLQIDFGFALDLDVRGPFTDEMKVSIFALF